MHFDCINGFLNSIKEIIWQTEAIYRCPLTDLYDFRPHLCFNFLNALIMIERMFYTKLDFLLQ